MVQTVFYLNSDRFACLIIHRYLTVFLLAPIVRSIVQLSRSCAPHGSRGLPVKPTMMWIHALLLSLLTLSPIQSAEAKVYQCEGAGGTTILTNQPNGKKGCRAVSTQSASPPGGYVPPADPVPEVPLDLPPPAMPPGALPMTPRQPILNQPSMPAASNDSSAPAAPEAQRCSPRVNPLNPFAGLNCSPAVDETKNP